MKGLKPSERQKVNEMNQRVNKMSDKKLMKEKSATPVHDEIIETGLNDPDVSKKEKEHLRRVKAAKEKKRAEGELTYKDINKLATKEREENYDKVMKDMEKKGDIKSAKERRKQAKDHGA